MTIDWVNSDMRIMSHLRTDFAPTYSSLCGRFGTAGDLPADLPADLRSDLRSDLRTDLPSDLPVDLTG